MPQTKEFTSFSDLASFWKATHKKTMKSKGEHKKRSRQAWASGPGATGKH